MKAIGLCLGASRVSMVIVERMVPGNIEVATTQIKSHDGDVVTAVMEMLASIDLNTTDRVAVTGHKFRNRVNLSAIPEAEAVETAYEYLKSKYFACDTIVSAGGETFIAYKLDDQGKIINVHTGNKCASGTGEFFLQQIKRMNLSVDEALDRAEINHPYTVASRCSVFCKSDCTHALNKGEAKGRVVAGLCKMMARKSLELVRKCKPNNILLVGGLSQNTVMLDYIRQELEPGQNLLVAGEAGYFEALGAALWALENETVSLDKVGNIFKGLDEQSSFTFFTSLQDYTGKVAFKTITTAQAQEGDECLVGLDVGSTTTKAVVMRTSDNALLASVYLRTNGDPIRAARECYHSLAEQISVPVKVTGIGVTGSGRQIAGLHASTECVINEIVAHATAAVYFDPEVDTIFEIGGQDAKYTYITNKVPSDYAMNEACSAGTGSFLEEAAKETMGIDTLEIADIAMQGTKPPNFNDQCAAFISSDIKSAIQEGIRREDIIAGLVYSVCQNYANRVKGNRPVGKKVFMQGGVCYNQAVPIAMAAITGKDIIVPPEPGLMGAYGVALEVKNRLEAGLVTEQLFDLGKLAAREAVYGRPFVCKGGKEQCDRKCKINMIELEGKKYPFGGACNKYVNLRSNVKYDVANLDLVALREKLVFDKYVPKVNRPHPAKKIGMLKSLLVNTLYPLYYNFFTGMGLDVVLADHLHPEGMERKGAPFCYPVEQAHGFMADLLNHQVDYVFLPHVMGLPVENGIKASVTCPLVQGEPYYLKAVFKELGSQKVLSPMLDFSKGYDSMVDDFVEIGRALGIRKSECMKAYEAAVQIQKACVREMRQIGRQVLEELEAEPGKIGIVLFGRSYNAFSPLGNMGIPHKFASRGYLILPWEFLSFEKEEPMHHMFWSSGQMILKSAKIVQSHPQLFGTYITNFSCGPDSFIIGYYRDIMGQKPSLIIELDSHTADAGIDTRIEAFLDIVKYYIELEKQKDKPLPQTAYRMAASQMQGDKMVIVDSFGQKHYLADETVQVIVPSMGSIGSKLFAASMKYAGVNVSYLQPATGKELSTGRANASCKECLPYILIVGSILNDIAQRRKNDGENRVLVYFVTDSSGPCRFGQYQIAIQRLIQKLKIPNVAILALTSDNGYAGLGPRFERRAWQSLVIADVLADIYSAILVLAKEKEAALTIFEETVEKIEQAVATIDWSRLKKILSGEARKLARIPLTGTIHEAPKVALLGEIFVRVDGFSRQYLVERLAQKGMVVKVAPVTEFVYFCDFLLQKSLYHVKQDVSERMLSVLKQYFKQGYEKEIKQILVKSGLYEFHMIDIAKITSNVEHLISPKFTGGDAALTVAAALTDIIDEVSGVISIGPFGCMPSRVAEAILTENINTEKPSITKNPHLVAGVMRKHPALPFLSIESDGNPFPQVIEAKLEIFCLQVARLHQAVLAQRRERVSRLG